MDVTQVQLPATSAQDVDTVTTFTVQMVSASDATVLDASLPYMTEAMARERMEREMAGLGAWSRDWAGVMFRVVRVDTVTTTTETVVAS